MVRRRKRSRATRPPAVRRACRGNSSRRAPAESSARPCAGRRRGHVVAAPLIGMEAAASRDGGRGALCRGAEFPARAIGPESGRDHSPDTTRSRSPRLLRASRRQTLEHRRAGPATGVVFEHATRHGAADLPLALVDLHGPHPSAPRRARQRRLLPRRREGHAGRAPRRPRRTRRAPSSGPGCSSRKWGLAQGFDEYSDRFDLSKYKVDLARARSRSRATR